MGIGERIADERKRLGLSQAAFAELVGVSFSSQRRYENESRAPDTGYLDSLRRCGVDVQYVITGRVKEAARGYSFELLAEFGLAIAKQYQISPSEIQNLADAVSEARKGEDESDSMEMRDVEQRVSSYEAAFFVYASKFFEKRLQSMTTLAASALDSSLLATILEGVEQALSVKKMTLKPAKKAQAVAMLYRNFKANGKVEPAMIDEAVKLAAD